MRKVYLYFGGNEGQGLRQFIEKYQINKEWIVETYEPEELCQIQSHISDLDFVQIHNKAVWTHTGQVTFSRHRNCLPGGSVECLMSDGNRAPGAYNFLEHNELITVDCIDVSEIFSKFSLDDFIVVKMDTEGSEFKILRKIIEDGNIKKINDLWIEWHSGDTIGESMETEQELISRITNMGINLYRWY